MIPLTKLQKEIMQEFYSIEKTRVIYDKKERQGLWQKSTKKVFLNLEEIFKKCPALAHQINKSYKIKNNIQSAIFSECVYAQTLANMFHLNHFINCSEDRHFIPETINHLLQSYHLVPRYCYSSDDKKRMLIQAGGAGGIDSALISVIDLNIYTIEFKEPKAKTSEPDLPKYIENGKLVVTLDFLERYPQFQQMLNEQKDLNFFEKMGNNIHNFSKESIHIAVSNNYVKKYADVICTEDKSGNLVMLPANQVTLWAKTEGEIRPAGRNHYKVWTPLALKIFLEKLNAKFEGNIVTVEKSKLELRKERGGNRKISGFKINPLFFIYQKDCTIKENLVSFDITHVRQLNPTIAGKMSFKNLEYNKVKDYYTNIKN